MRVDKDTLIFCSFSKVAGNNGCKMFNAAFNYYRLNALYKSFSIDNIKGAVNAARTLNFKGFAVSMPYKKEVLNFVDEVDETAAEIGSANTVVINDNILKAYNTDYIAAKTLLREWYNNSFIGPNKLCILGDGGLAAAVKYAAKEIDMSFDVITRVNWGDIDGIENSIIFNCTPINNMLINDSNIFINSSITSTTGLRMSKIQASYQFKLYTGLEFPLVLT